MTSWAARDDVLFVEWDCAGTVGTEHLMWSGANRLRVWNGKIIDELIYYDTLPLRSALAKT